MRNKRLSIVTQARASIRGEEKCDESTKNTKGHEKEKRRRANTEPLIKNSLRLIHCVQFFVCLRGSFLRVIRQLDDDLFGRLDLDHFHFLDPGMFGEAGLELLRKALVQEMQAFGEPGHVPHFV